jgi:hypothetical protein
VTGEDDKVGFSIPDNTVLFNIASYKFQTKIFLVFSKYLLRTKDLFNLFLHVTD